MNSTQPPPGPQPYQQPGIVQQNKVVSSRGWHNAKIVLGSLSMTVCVVILGLGGGLASNYPFSGNAWIDLIFGYCPAILALGWQTAEFITLCVRRDRGIHPGAHVALHLLIWLGSAVCVGFLTALTVYDSDCGSYYCYDYYGSSSSSSSQYYGSYLALEQALTAFVYLLLIIHFTLFVRYCIECNRRNMNRPTIIMVSGQPGMYYMPAPQMVQGGQYPMTYAPPPQMPPTAYNPAPPGTPGTHTSMYGGGYYAPPTHPEGKAELHSVAPSFPTSVTPVSSEVAHDRR